MIWIRLTDSFPTKTEMLIWAARMRPMYRAKGLQLAHNTNERRFSVWRSTNDADHVVPCMYHRRSGDNGKAMTVIAYHRMIRELRIEDEGMVML